MYAALTYYIASRKNDEGFSLSKQMQPNFFLGDIQLPGCSKFESNWCERRIPVGVADVSNFSRREHSDQLDYLTITVSYIKVEFTDSFATQPKGEVITAIK
jgi:hypothetical protein